MIAVGGIAMVTIVVVVWQVFLSWRAKMSIAREKLTGSSPRPVANLSAPSSSSSTALATT
jgi:hypothetical protein